MEPHPASRMTLRYVARTFVGDELCSGAKVLRTPSHVKETFTAAMVMLFLWAAERSCCVRCCWASR